MIVDGPPKFDDAVPDGLGGLEDHELLASGQTDDRIRGNFYVFYKIGVNHERYVVQAREPDHGISN
jgi:hypothetical protein